MVRTLSLILSVVQLVWAQQALYYQCGGIGWTGLTTCVSGACCQFCNNWYSQCLLCTTTGTGAASTSSSTSIVAASVPSSATTVIFTNPVLYEDFADNDIFRGPDNYFYYSASNMHYSPGAPILRSADLVNWEFIGHSVPSPGAFGSQYNMTDNQTAYDGGTWASTLRYRESNVTGPWTQAAAMYGTCYYDCGLLMDDDDTMYVVYGGTNVSIAQLSSDGLSQVKSQQLFSSPSIEGNRLYKRNGTYYVLDDHPGDTTFIWKSTDIWSGWEQYTMIYDMEAPLPDGGLLSQGSLVETQTGDWYFISFSWAYPAGRMPVLAPITWNSDGYPVLTTVDGTWGAEYPYPLEPVATPSWTGTDSFPGNSLGVAWEWNHNPDETKYTVNNGLSLYTATVTTDLYHARNTLTHRLHGLQPVATIAMDTSDMADGDRAGLAAFRDFSAYIGIWRSGSDYTVVNVQNMTQDANNSWATISNGTAQASASISKGQIWLRGNLDARANGTHLVSFSYSTDGSTFQPLGTEYSMNIDWEYFIGYRWGIFNFATAALGGSASISSFTQV